MLGKWRAIVTPALLALVLHTWVSVPKTPTFAGSRVERYTQAMEHYRERMGYPYTFKVQTVPYHQKWCAWVGMLTPGVAQAGLVDPPSGGCSAYPPEYWALHESCHLRMMHIESALSMSEEGKESEVRRCMLWYGRYRQ